MARPIDSPRMVFLQSVCTVAYGGSPITSVLLLLLVTVLTGLAVTLAPELATKVMVVGIAGLIASWLIVRNPFRALNVSLFVVLVAWTKFRHRDPMATLAGVVDWQIALELGLYALLGIVVLRVWFVANVGRLKGYPIDIVALAYVALVFASIAWSPVMRITAVRAVQMAIQTLVVLAIVRVAGREGLFRNLSSSILTYVVVFGLIALLIPGARGSQVVEGGVSRFYWFSMHPGSVATVAAVAGLFVLSGILFAPAGRRPTWMGIPLLVWLVVLMLLVLSTRVRGQTIAFAAAGTVLVLLRFAKSWTVALGASLALLVAAVFLSYSVSPAEVLLAGEGSGNPLLRFLYRGQTASELTTLSSRTDLWQIAASLVRKHPLIGHGYVSSRAVLLQEIPWAAYAHNAWFQVLLDLGIVGLVLITTLILSPLRVMREQPFNAGGAVAPAILSITSFLLITSITGEGFAGGPGFETVLLLSLALGSARPSESKWSSQ